MHHPITGIISDIGGHLHFRGGVSNDQPAALDVIDMAVDRDGAAVAAPNWLRDVRSQVSVLVEPLDVGASTE